MKRAEQQIHKTVVDHLRTRGTTGLVFFHPSNGGWRSPIEAKIFKSLGVRAGVPDLILLHESKPYALELKAEGGRPTPAQVEFINEWRAAGGRAAVCYGVDEAVHMLEDWGLLKGSMV